MRFQPGQSGNPAGRPPGARNKKTIAMEEELAARAHEAVDRIVLFAKGGNAAAMRICAEWVRPTGTNRPLELELPEVQCSDDARVVLNIVLAAFACGAITVRQFPVVLGGLERAVRIAERIQQLAEREQKGRQIRGETHPSLPPHPVPDPMEPIFAAIARGEDPFPEDAGAAEANGEGEALYSPVNSDEAPPAEPGSDPEAISIDIGAAVTAMLTSSLPRAAGEGGSPERSEGEPGGGNREATGAAVEREALYSPVNSDANVVEGPPPGAPGASPGSPPSPASGGGISAPLQLNPG
jgi:hypothetical protein